MPEIYMLGNTKVKIYDNYIVNDVDTQKKYINVVANNLIRKLAENS
ncbi:MAG: hypothetical protein K1W33_03100 [Clostridia bacterium]